MGRNGLILLVWTGFIGNLFTHNKTNFRSYFEAYNLILISTDFYSINFKSKSHVLIVLIKIIYEDNIIIPAQFGQVFDGKRMDEWQLDYFL